MRKNNNPISLLIVPLFAAGVLVCCTDGAKNEVPPFISYARIDSMPIIVAIGADIDYFETHPLHEVKVVVEGTHEWKTQPVSDLIEQGELGSYRVGDTVQMLVLLDPNSDREKSYPITLHLQQQTDSTLTHTDPLVAERSNVSIFVGRDSLSILSSLLVDGVDYEVGESNQQVHLGLKRMVFPR